VVTAFKKDTEKQVSAISYQFSASESQAEN